MIKYLDANDGNVKRIMERDTIGHWDLHVCLFSCKLYMYIYTSFHWTTDA